VETTVRNMQASIQGIEKHLGQIAATLAERPPGSLPSNTETNPREHLQAITLRSGKEVEVRPNTGPSENAMKNMVRGNTSIDREEANDSHSTLSEPQAKEKQLQEHQPKVPYPARLKRDKEDTQFKKFLEIIKQLHINLPLVEAFAQMPKYAKFMKELLTNRKKLEEASTVSLGENCSAIIQSKLPEKIKDPGGLIIECHFGDSIVEKALADSGASINVMPYKLFLKLGLQDLEPTRITIQLADRSVRRPRAVVSDVIVKVGGLVFPSDFVILDVDEDTDVPIILGRPFLATSRALLDIQDGKMTLRAGSEEATFKIPEAMKHPKEFDDTSYALDDTELQVQDCIQEVLMINPLDEILQEVDKDGEDTLHVGVVVPNKLQESPPRTSPDKLQGKCKGERSWKRAWKKLSPQVDQASKKSNDTVHTAYFIDLGMNNIDSLLSLNLPAGSSFVPMTRKGKTFSFEPP